MDDTPSLGCESIGLRNRRSKIKFVSPTKEDVLTVIGLGTISPR